MAELDLGEIWYICLLLEEETGWIGTRRWIFMFPGIQTRVDSNVRTVNVNHYFYASYVHMFSILINEMGSDLDRGLRSVTPPST